MLLVTGATGYLGAALVALLHERGHAVRAVVRDPARADVLPASDDRGPPGGGPVERVAADLADADSLVRAMDGCEGVFHVAAAVGAPGPEAHDLNVGGTGRVLDAARRAGVRRLVHTSTSAAILQGPDGAGADPPRPAVVAEDAPGGTVLTDTYSTTKAEAEERVLAAAAAPDGVDAVVATVVNIYGPSPRGPHSYNLLLAAAGRGEVAEIVDTTVGWTLARDVAEGQLALLERGERGRRYVLCGEVASFPRVLDTYCALVRSPHRVTVRPPGSSLRPDAPPFADRSEVYGHVGGYRVDDTGARALGITCRGVDEGLAVTAAWLPTAAHTSPPDRR